jgi:cellulose biosynthesis protein BcsQ
MKTIAVYNMKGGVGKTTTAVSLSYLAAAAGRRTLLWDLDPQAAASFAFRAAPRVPGFGRKSVEDGALGAAIKETDYDNLYLLPADFAYRKYERFLDSVGKPDRVLPSLLATVGRDFDVVFFDCPAGSSLLTEGTVAAADAVLVPTIPTVLSLRTLAQLIKWADRSVAPSRLAAFLNMVDSRKALHRRASEWCAARSEVFLSAQIPYASAVEQMTVRRMPLPLFAARAPAALAFAQIWTELETWFQQGPDGHTRQPHRWADMLQEVEGMIERLDSTDMRRPEAERPGEGNRCIVHRFDTEGRDLARSGYVLELRERPRGLLLVAARSEGDDLADLASGAQARIDDSWALEILSGELSPLVALERRLGRSGRVAEIRAVVGGRQLVRTQSWLSPWSMTIQSAPSAPTESCSPSTSSTACGNRPVSRAASSDLQTSGGHRAVHKLDATGG